MSKTRKIRSFEIRIATRHRDHDGSYIRDSHRGYSEGINGAEAITKFLNGKERPKGLYATPARKLDQP